MDAPSLPLDGSAEEVLTNLHELVLILSEAGVWDALRERAEQLTSHNTCRRPETRIGG